MIRPAAFLLPRHDCIKEAVMKYTPVQLSKILTAHARGCLVKYGRKWRESGVDRGCINQYAFNKACPDRAAWIRYYAVNWFDTQYQRTWSVDQFLRELEKAELA